MKTEFDFIEELNVSKEFEDLEITLEDAENVALTVNARRC